MWQKDTPVGAESEAASPRHRLWRMETRGIQKLAAIYPNQLVRATDKGPMAYSRGSCLPGLEVFLFRSVGLSEFSEGSEAEAK